MVDSSRYGGENGVYMQECGSACVCVRVGGRLLRVAHAYMYYCIVVQMYVDLVDLSCWWLFAMSIFVLRFY